jgi:hypothetical protein
LEAVARDLRLVFTESKRFEFSLLTLWEFWVRTGMWSIFTSKALSSRSEVGGESIIGGFLVGF